ncbi:hypothetical protein B0J17DRAFT_101998 [Rhizoctonia solani]|nr:hypothetical protein B0J17DRAFT_101998 [Rhizoctonia solani]
MISNTSPPSIELIDWQGVSVGPLFQQATFAIFAQYHGDSRIQLPIGAQLPKNFDSLPWHEKIYLKHQRQLALRHLYYCSRIEPSALDAQQWAHDVHLRFAIDEASRTWDLGLRPFRKHLSNLSIIAGARELTDPSTPDDVDARIRVYDEEVSRLYKELEVEGDGWVPTERYDDVYTLNKKCMETWDEVTTGGPYPIANGAPSWFVSS